MLAAVDGLALQHLLDPDLDRAFAVLTRMEQAILKSTWRGGLTRCGR